MSYSYIWENSESIKSLVGYIKLVMTVYPMIHSIETGLNFKCINPCKWQVLITRAGVYRLSICDHNLNKVNPFCEANGLF